MPDRKYAHIAFDLLRRGLRGLVVIAVATGRRLGPPVGRAITEAVAHAVRVLIAVAVTLAAGAAGVVLIFALAAMITDGGTWIAGHDQLDGVIDWLKTHQFSLPTPEVLKKSLTLGVTAFGGAALIGLLKEVAGVLPALWAYVRRSDFEQAIKAGGTVLVSMAALSLSLVGFQIDPKSVTDLIPGSGQQQQPPPPPAPGASPIVLNIGDPERAFRVVEPASASRLRFMLTFSGEATRESLARGSGRGLELDAGYDKWLRPWLLDLASCAAPGRPVEITIAGFASSSDWAPEVRGTVSDEMNLRLANLRASRVRERLDAALASPRLERAAAARHFVVKVHEWPSIESMQEHRWFNDRITPTTYSSRRGRLTRRADIWVETSACDPSTPPPVDLARTDREAE